MDFMEIEEARCADPNCYYAAFNEEHALHTGWAVVEGELFCPLHHAQARMKANRAAQKDQVRRSHHDSQAKKGFTAAEYAQWDKFQSDLADYHRKTGKLAPKPLRLMNPFQWLYLTKKRGPIDVEAEVQRMDQAQKDYEAKIRASLRNL